MSGLKGFDVTETPLEKLAAIKKAATKSFLFVGIFSFFVNILMLTVPLYMLQIFDRVLAGHSADTLIYLSLIAIGALLVLGLLDLSRSRVLVRISHWLDNQLGAQALGKGPDDMLTGGNYASQSLRDIATVRGFLSGPSIFSLFDSPWVPFFLLIVFLLHPLLGMIATIGAVLLFILALVNEILTAGLLMMASQQQMKNQYAVDKTLLNSEAIQAMGMLPNIVVKWFHDNEKVLNLQSLASDRAGLILSISKFTRLATQLLILGMGAYLVIKNQLTPGSMIAGSIIASRALAPIEQTIGTWKQWKAARRSYDRLRQYFLSASARGEGMELPKPKGSIKVENITYMPPGTRKPIIYGVDFQLDSGDILALIGPSGSGKSTLARLMLGIWKPVTGVARLDGANTFEWERTQFGEHVGYLPQNVDLFNGTIRENIARMKEGDDEAVINAAKQAGAHELILKFPGGYDFNIDTFTLSGGQRQRIALARAFYGNPCFIVLDEPNASLDNDGDIALSNAIAEAKNRNTTMVLISHRPNLVQYADKIMILNQGRVQSFGPRDEILQQLQQNKQRMSETNE